MANSTFIDYEEDKGFWIDEAYMELVFYFIWKTFNRINPDVDFKEKMEWYLESAASSGLYGMLVLGWQDILKTPKEEEEMIEILETTKKDLEVFGEFISIEELTEAASYEKNPEYRSKWSKPLKTEEVIKVIEALITMLKKEWTEDQNLDFDYDGTLG